MRMFVLIILAIGFTALGFQTSKTQQLDIQGHRGARGLMPENTIPAFLRALDYGVTTIELDVVITGDSMVVVSHEPYFSSAICNDPEGRPVKSRVEKTHNIFKMPYEEIQKYDCGSRKHPNFPEQTPMPVQKPLLIDVIKEVEQYIKSYTNYEVDYNIEIKSGESGDGKFHPSPDVFSDLVYQTVDQYLPWNRVVVQSFDFRVLRYWNEKYPEVRLAALIGTPGTASAKINSLGFKPDIYSPHYKLLNKRAVLYLHDQGIKVVPWTVNDKNEMKKQVLLGVDGIITDYPDRAASLGYTLFDKSDKN